jgi:chromosomal replication initiation ATPase DnaA
LSSENPPDRIAGLSEGIRAALQDVETVTVYPLDEASRTRALLERLSERGVRADEDAAATAAAHLGGDFSAIELFAEDVAQRLKGYALTKKVVKKVLKEKGLA